MITATFNNVIIAEANDEDTIRIEGGTYFPPNSIKKELFTKTDHSTTCHWKGEASYYDVTVDGETAHNVAWTYEKPMDGSIDKVGKDFTGYVSFYPQVTIS